MGGTSSLAFSFSVVLLLTWIAAIIIRYVSLIPGLCLFYLESVTCFLTFRFRDVASFFAYMFCVTLVQTGISAMSISYVSLTLVFRLTSWASSIYSLIFGFCDAAL